MAHHRATNSCQYSPPGLCPFLGPSLRAPRCPLSPSRTLHPQGNSPRQTQLSAPLAEALPPPCSCPMSCTLVSLSLTLPVVPSTSSRFSFQNFLTFYPSTGTTLDGPKLPADTHFRLPPKQTQRPSVLPPRSARVDSGRPELGPQVSSDTSLAPSASLETV